MTYVSAERHWLSTILMLKASLFSEVNSTETFICKFGGWVSQYATVSKCAEKKWTFIQRRRRKP